MFKLRMFEKTPLDEYNKKLEYFKNKFEIFSKLKEFQKIGRMEVSKKEFYTNQDDEKNDDTGKDTGKDTEKIIEKITSRKLHKDVKNIKVYAVAEKKKNNEVADKESDKESDEESNKESDEESDKESDEESDKESDEEANEEADKESDKESDEEVNEEADKESDKEANKEDQIEEKKYYKYYIFDIGYFQKLSRWWYAENREKTNKYIEEDFSDFMKFLNDVKNLYNIYSLNIYYKKTLKNLHKFINKITPGLYNLKKTYSNNNKIKAQIDSVILTLLDFKNETIIKKKNPSSLLSILHQNKKHFIF